MASLAAIPLSYMIYLSSSFSCILLLVVCHNLVQREMPWNGLSWMSVLFLGQNKFLIL